MEKIVVYLPFKEHHKKLLEAAVNGRAEIIYTNEPSALYDATIIAGCPNVEITKKAKNLKWVQMSWAGTDLLTSRDDFESDRIAVSNMRGVYGPIVSEYLVAGVMACCRNFQKFSYDKQNKVWDDTCRNLTLENKKALILGVGNIGSNVAKRLKGFDTYTIGFARSARPVKYFDEVHTIDELKTFLPQADYVIITLPSDKKLAHLIGETELRMMKKDAVLANAGRGLIVDTMALAKVMKEGHLHAACLDVFEEEPLPKDHPLWDVPNLIITPHVAGVDFGICFETEDKIAKQIADNIGHYLDTGEIPNAVNR